MPKPKNNAPINAAEKRRLLDDLEYLEQTVSWIDAHLFDLTEYVKSIKPTKRKRK